MPIFGLNVFFQAEDWTFFKNSDFDLSDMLDIFDHCLVIYIFIFFILWLIQINIDSK